MFLFQAKNSILVLFKFATIAEGFYFFMYTMVEIMNCART